MIAELRPEAKLLRGGQPHLGVRVSAELRV